MPMKYTGFFLMVLFLYSGAHAGQNPRNNMQLGLLQVYAYTFLAQQYPHLVSLATYQRHVNGVDDSLELNTIKLCIEAISGYALIHRNHTLEIVLQEVQDAFNQLPTKNVWQPILEELDRGAPHPPIEIGPIRRGGIRVATNNLNNNR